MSLPCKKTSFADEQTAMRYVYILQNTSRRSVIPHRAYLCEKCLNWHITSLTIQKEKDEDLKMRREIQKLERAIKERNKQIENKDNKIQELKDNMVTLNRRIAMHDKSSLSSLKKINELTEKIEELKNQIQK